jgi:flavodoxin
MMKALVIYYSQSGVTRQMAADIAAALGAEIEELRDTVKRGGPMGFVHAGSDAGAEKLTVIEPTTKNPADYDLAIIGTPTWAGKMCPATRTYLTENKGKLNKVAFFCASAFGRSQPLLDDMARVTGKMPLAQIMIKRGERKSESYRQAIQQFVDAIRS